MQNQLVSKLARANRQIIELCNLANDVLALESTPEQRLLSLSWAKGSCRWLKESATPAVRKLTEGKIPDSEAWWVETIQQANQFKDLLEVLADRIGREFKDAKTTLVLLKELDQIEETLRERSSQLGAVLDVSGLGDGTPPTKVERPDALAIQSDLRQIAKAFEGISNGMLSYARRKWQNAGAILHRLNVRLGNPKENPLHWRAGLDIREADSGWIDATEAFVKSANMTFENNALEEDDIRYMSRKLGAEAKHALESFGELATGGQSRVLSPPVPEAVANNDGKPPPKKRGKKPATADKITEACGVVIAYKTGERGPQDFCDWWNRDEKVCRITPKWLNTKVTWVKKLMKEDRKKGATHDLLTERRGTSYFSPHLGRQVVLDREAIRWLGYLGSI
ncbi:MAG: hypothetical protein NT013_03910 [Planctomycetia bacterium]|nr:hypothetical protein [Planctomycetia bacterium]